MSEQPERDSISGVETTGHEWDGIKELNNPLPKWWLYVLYVSIVWAIGYWFVMPAWPLVNSYTKGFLGHSQRSLVVEEIATARAAQSGLRDRIAALDVEAVAADPELRAFAAAGGKAAFGDNCAACHGTGATGAPGYPNLNDDDWIWGGTLADIETTLTVGIRSTHEDTRWNEMPAFLSDEILDRGQVNDVADYLLVLSGQAGELDQSSASVVRGAEVYADNCAACHQDDGGGDRETGTPRLDDAIWLYGGDKRSIVETVANSRAGVMPHWQGRLDEVTIKQLVVYLQSLGGTE